MPEYDPIGVDVRAAQRKLSSARSKLRRTTQLDYQETHFAAGQLAGIIERLEQIERAVNP